MNRISKLIKELMEENKVNQTELSKLTGITQSSISDYVNGKYTPKQDKTDLIARAFGVSPAIFLNLEVNDTEPKSIPIVGTIAAGTPILAEDNITGYFKIDASIHADFIVKVKGDSMINVGIDTGDLAFIHRQCTVENGEIAAVLIEDRATLKRFYKDDGIITLIAENNNIAPTTYTNGNIKILGKLVAVLNII